jgi:hypothetical protein
MTTGKISKLVSSYGATWGRIKPAGEDRQVFFNARSVVGFDYLDLTLGQEVEFTEEADRANGDARRRGPYQAFKAGLAVTLLSPLRVLGFHRWPRVHGSWREIVVEPAEAMCLRCNKPLRSIWRQVYPDDGSRCKPRSCPVAVHTGIE